MPVGAQRRFLTLCSEITLQETTAVLGIKLVSATYKASRLTQVLSCTSLISIKTRK